MDWFSFFISLFTIITPSIVSIITIIHQYKVTEDNNRRILETEKLNNENQIVLKRLDYYYSKKSPAINKYLDSLFSYLKEPSENNRLNCQVSMAKACMYVSDEVNRIMSEIDYLQNENMLDEIKSHCLRHLINSLIEDSQQYYNSN